MRPRSITGPLILVVFGVVLLLNNLGYNIPLWSFLADYWPFLLIAMGVIALAEVLVHVSRGSTQLPRPAYGGWLFWVLLWMFLAAWGASRVGAHFGRFNVGNGISILGNGFDYQVNAETSATGVNRLIIEDLGGNLAVHGGDASGVSVSGRKIIRTFSRDAADQADRESAIRLDRENDSLVLHTQDGRRMDFVNISGDLDVVVPRGFSVETRNRGNFSAQDLNGSVTVTRSGGDTRITNIGGDLRVNSSGGGLVRADSIKGAIQLRGRGSDIQLESISGPVTIEGEFPGSLEFRALAGGIHMSSSRGNFEALSVPGSVTMDLGSLRVENVIGPVRLRANSRDVQVIDATNALALDVDRGDIDISASALPLPKMDLHSRHGNITLDVPADASFDLDAITRAGEASNDFSDRLTNQSNGGVAYIRGSVGTGNPLLKLVTDRGNIAIRKK